jgi:uncharacterized protein with HEPN domain
LTWTERDRVHLAYIAESIDRIERYTRDGSDAFRRELMVQDAVLRRLETLADAAHKLPEFVKGRHPDIPWRDIYAFRNLAAHAYTKVDLNLVWRVVVDDLPPLKAMVERELARGGPDRGAER